jgi:ABC-2 type transport system ATP-binding protein
MHAIETSNLTKEYGIKPAVKDLNLSIRQGEVYGFIGRNGAGKTTTINMILSLIHPTSGTISINGKAVSFSDPSYKNVIGFVPDVPVFPGYMNAREYIKYACEMYDVPMREIKQKTDDVLAFVELREPKKKISAYSRGMKQRLAIAQALVHDPSIIIMDEPTSALDPIGRKDVMNIIMKLKGQKTIFYSTHILEDVEKVCDRIGLLDKGVLVLESTIEEIQNKYYQNDMLITTKEPKEKVYELLQENAIKNDIRQSDKGIICALEGETSAQEVLEFLLDKGIHIIEYKRLNASLEDVFIRVTNEETT